MLRQSLFRRGMLFVTFLGSCVSMALTVAALGTRQWVLAAARRTTNPQESQGRISFGLFDGRKELNVAYGWRSYDIDVVYMLKYEPEFLMYGLWVGTVAFVCLALLFSILSGIFAAVNTATNTYRCLTGTSGLYLWNLLSMLSAIAAVAFWIGQFYFKIQHNVLSREDRDNMWVSEGMAELGYSFWFIVGSAVTSFINIIIVFIANSDKEVETVIPVLEEKTNGAIMLY